MIAALGALTAILLAAPAHAYGPETNYAVHCQGCHLADGSASPGRVPALADSVARFLHHPDGRAFLVRVPGVANAPLDAEALAALLNWTLARFDAAHVPTAFAPYDAAEVARLRAQPLLDVTVERERILDALR
jgi:mono/diheme cytochrome c family protein